MSINIIGSTQIGRVPSGVNNSSEVYIVSLYDGTYAIVSNKATWTNTWLGGRGEEVLVDGKHKKVRGKVEIPENTEKVMRREFGCLRGKEAVQVFLRKLYEGIAKKEISDINSGQVKTAIRYANTAKEDEFRVPIQERKSENGGCSGAAYEFDPEATIKLVQSSIQYKKLDPRLQVFLEELIRHKSKGYDSDNTSIYFGIRGGMVYFEEKNSRGGTLLSYSRSGREWECLGTSECKSPIDSLIGAIAKNNPTMAGIQFYNRSGETVENPILPLGLEFAAQEYGKVFFYFPE